MLRYASLVLFLVVSGAANLVAPAGSPAWAQTADFDDAEAQLKVRQAASAASAGARRVDALRAELVSERQRVVQTDGEHDLNQIAVQTLEQELRTAEARQRELDAALKAAQDARTRGLSLRQQGTPPPAAPAPAVSTQGEQERAEAAQKLREEQAALALREQIAKAAAEQKLREEQAAARAREEQAARAAAEQKLREEQAAARALQDRAARAAAEERLREEQAARALREQIAKAAAAQKERDEQARQLAEEERKAAALKRAAEDEARRKAEAESQKALESAEVALGLSIVERRQIQEALTALGFDTAGTDGAFGAKTREMIGRWQSRRGKPATTYLDRAQVAQLLAEAVAPLARLDEERRKRETAATVPVPAAATTAPGPAALSPEVARALGRWTGSIIGCCNDGTVRNLQVSWTPGAIQCGWSIANKPPVDATSGCTVSASEVRLTTSANSLVVMRRGGAGLIGTFTLRNGNQFPISMAREGTGPKPSDEVAQKKLEEARKPAAAPAPNVASAAPPRPSSWSAVVRLIRDRSANNCDENLPRFALAFDGTSFDVTVDGTKLLTVRVSGDGTIGKERFRTATGGRLELSGNVRTRDLELTRWDQLCRWRLVPG